MTTTPGGGDTGPSASDGVTPTWFNEALHLITIAALV